MFDLFKSKKTKNVMYATEPEMAILRNVAVGTAVTLAAAQGGGTWTVTAQDETTTVLDNWKTVESNLLVYV